MEGYSSVWQSWDLLNISNISIDENTNKNSHPVYRRNIATNVRQDVQRARIAKRLSIPALATHIKCDVITLAAFERGDDILPEGVHKRLLKELGL
jgi:ribosome-binding protein aMBF1 (putative translation factor)